MIKVRLENTIAGGGGGSWDGTTLVVPGPFTLVGGFEQAKLPFPAGAVAAALGGKASAGDCYLLHATMYKSGALSGTDLLQVVTRAPENVRYSWTPFPGNTRVALVRPDDTLKFTLAATGQAFLELLLEPLANENEFGPVLLDFLREARASVGPGATAELTVSANTVLPPFSGVLRVTSTAGAGIAVTLPPAAGQTLNDHLIVTRFGAGAVAVTPAGADTINKAAAAVNLASNNTSVGFWGAGTDWAAF